MILCPVQSPCRITQGFGKERYVRNLAMGKMEPVYARFGLKGHNGIDFTGAQAGVSVPIVSPYDALVYAVENEGDKGYGLHIRLHVPLPDGRTREVVLAHLRYAEVKSGDRVNLGDRIATMGGAPNMPGHGFSSALHLHVGLRYLDPQGNVIDAGNGYAGYVDFERYLLFWKNAPDMVTHPFG